MSLATPSKVGKLQQVLRDKAKAEPNYRFYSLYDKVYRADVLRYAYDRCKANGGAAGVDGQTFADIEQYGAERWLGELAEKLKTGTYQPEAVRRVWIPKADGNLRPLGIPTIADRVVQMAFVLVVEPIFDQDLQPEQHAYRANHSAHQALCEVQRWLDQRYTEIIDADLSGYFDSIPHHELLKSVARRIVDRRMLHLVKMWLEAAVEETDARGKVTRSTRNKDEGRGTPQGGVVSPLLANLYMRRFVLGWKTLKDTKRLDCHIVNYADDFVICCPPDCGVEAMGRMRDIMKILKLTINEKKTRQCLMPSEPFTFLGFTFGRQVSWKTNRRYIAPAPAKKKVQAICKKISQVMSRQTQWRDQAEIVGKVNQLLCGWANYFSLGYVTHAWQVVQNHTCRRLRQWLHGKHKRRKGLAGPPNIVLHERYGVINLFKAIPRRPLWANPR